MASLRLCGAAARIPAAQDTHRHRHRHRHRSFHLFKLGPNQLPSNLRFNNTATLQIRQGLFTALASNSNPSGEDKSDETKTTQGPPFLTILAGFLVFFLVCWNVGFTLMWLIGLFLKLFSSQ